MDVCLAQPERYGCTAAVVAEVQPGELTKADANANSTGLKPGRAAKIAASLAELAPSNRNSA